jgi:alpha-amylase/alpha-mannosidase (GH57 family)
MTKPTPPAAEDAAAAAGAAVAPGAAVAAGAAEETKEAKEAKSSEAAPAAKEGSKLDLLLLWHMHQPDYRDHHTGEFTMPWVYLHATKDYTDMAWHLEQHPGMRAVVNFVPVLLDQIEDYCEQFAEGTLRDPLLRLLARTESTPLSPAERWRAFDQCFRADHHRLIAPFPPYKRLFDVFTSVQAQGKDSLHYLSDDFVYDLVTWYHLSWTGESVKRESEVVARLMAKGSSFSVDDRTVLLAAIAEQVSGVIPRYRALAQRGQIELSTTPHYHPLSPLMLDFRSARESLPDAPLPRTDHYPGGRERVIAHLDSALASHERRFGAPPRGLWPAEGALSSSFAALLAERNIRWTASSEGVLANSLRASGQPDAPVQHQPYRASTTAPGLVFFFRNDRLSDLIGFVYSKWHGRDAANNFIHELDSIAARAAGGPRPLVSVMLDGENAWEYYPYNGYFFLSDLYKNLSSNPSIRTVTGSDVVAALDAQAAAAAPADATAAATAAARTIPVGEIAKLAAGSWVYGNLATWIGARDKNRAWDLLCAAKASYDEAMESGLIEDERRAQATAQLADCEASDWFWWPGDDNPSVSVSSFESLFRAKLANLYRLLRLTVPEDLAVAFSRGSHTGTAAEAGGTMRRGSES